MPKKDKIYIATPIEEWKFDDPEKEIPGGQSAGVPPKYGIDHIVFLNDGGITILCYHKVTKQWYPEWNGRSFIVDEGKYKNLTHAVTHVLEAVSLPSEEESNTELNKLAEQIGLNRAKPSDVALGWRKCYDWLCNVINDK